jgi:hypothetical protein
MDKDQALEEFFRNFKKTLSITCLFSKDHPSFVKAVGDFKNTVDATLNFLSPLKIGVTPDSFLVENKYFSGGLLYGELAKMLHLRRVKTIEIKPGVSLEELVVFFHQISIHPKEIMANGGMSNILGKAKVAHISIEELDYSQLLKGSGTEYKDIWAYLLQEAVEKDDSAKANALADNFDKIVQHFRIKDLLENEKLKENIHQFIVYLKDKGKDKFLQCAKEMASAILKEKEMLQQADIDKIRIFFKDLSEADLADILSQDLLTDERFDHLSFGLFSKILDEEKHKNIAAQAAKNLQAKSFRDNRMITKNIQKLFSSPASSGVSQVYQNALSSFLSNISFDNLIAFDRELAQINYDSLLLNLFNEEKNQEHLITILEKITVELDRLVRKRDLGYLKSLLEVIDKKRLQDSSTADLFDGLKNLIYNLLEDVICEQESVEDFQYFIDAMQKSTLGLDFYLGKIFNENKVNANRLKLFLKFFPTELPIFYQNLEKKTQDMEFLIRVIESLSAVSHPQTMDIFKHIYSFANNFIKIEVLQAMQRLSRYDEEFLLSILENADITLKKEALLILSKEEKSRRKALRKLFAIKSPWGTKNSFIMENILVVEETGLKEAKDYLVAISKKHFFWNRDIKKEASRVLKRWAT